MPQGEVTIGVTESEIEIQGNGPRFNLRPLNVDDFPTQEALVTDGVEVDGEELADAISQVNDPPRLTSCSTTYTYDSSTCGCLGRCGRGQGLIGYAKQASISRPHRSQRRFGISSPVRESG